ncbi:MAG TPA: substrate-binding domain-containing protein [Solirubrobacterales bacterium]|nr:substrate-binding domain-containing protein [Solirubrobacterales bacterium]
MRHFDQLNGFRGLLFAAALLAVAVGVAACGGSSGSSSSGAATESEAKEPTAGGGKEDGSVSHTVSTSWGTFELSPKIAEKVQNGEPINYLFSFEASGTPGFGEQFTAGFEYGCEQGEKIYPLHCEVVAPVQTNINEQISQVQAKVAANQVDCLSIQPPTETAVNALINEVSAKGIPVFAVGEENHANALMNFTQHHETEGEVAAETVIEFMEEEGKEFKNFALTSGLPTLGWAQGRMAGFEKKIKEDIPGAKFITDKANPYEIPLEPGPGYDAAKSFIAAHPEVEVFMNTDISGEPINKAISDSGKTGKIFSIAWNPTMGQLEGIEKGLQIATVDQRWFDQAAYGGEACATFLKTGKILPNTQKPAPITKAKVAEERQSLEKIENAEG